MPFTDSGSVASFDPCRHLSASRLSALADGLFPCYAQPARPVLPSPRHRRLRARRQRRMRLRAPSTRRRPCSAAQRNVMRCRLLQGPSHLPLLAPSETQLPRNPKPRTARRHGAGAFVLDRRRRACAHRNQVGLPPSAFRRRPFPMARRRLSGEHAAGGWHRPISASACRRRSRICTSPRSRPPVRPHAVSTPVPTSARRSVRTL